MKNRMRSWNVVYDMFFIIPAFILYSALIVLPAAKGIFFYSFTNWNPIYGVLMHNGFANLVSLTKDKVFINSIIFTSKYAILYVIAVNIISLILALCIESGMKLKKIARSIFFIPNVLSIILVSYIWIFILRGPYPEVVNFLGLYSLDISWFGTPNTALLAFLIVSIWHSLGFLLVLYIAGLQTIPVELYEAAEIDGASSLNTVLYITIPLLLPVITINIFLSISSAFKVFEIPFVLSRGGPGRLTETLALNIYNEAFNSYNFGYACTKALVMLVFVSIITFIQIRITSRRELSL